MISYYQQIEIENMSQVNSLTNKNVKITMMNVICVSFNGNFVISSIRQSLKITYCMCYELT